MGSLDDENEKNAAARRPATAAKMPLRLVPFFVEVGALLQLPRRPGVPIWKGGGNRHFQFLQLPIFSDLLPNFTTFDCNGTLRSKTEKKLYLGPG